MATPFRCLSVAILIAVPAVPAFAGELTPPPGPIQPTDRVTLNAQTVTLPYTIDQPGSYVLTSSLTGVAGQHGIIIKADNVTIDLNGFTLQGVPGSLNGITVVEAESPPGLEFQGLAVVDGNIEDWDGIGVATGLDSPNGFSAIRAARLENLHFRRCLSGFETGVGLSDALGGYIVRNCTMSDCAGAGCNASGGVILDSCTAIGNGNGGFLMTSAVATNCVASDNQGAGFEGASLTLESCSSLRNTQAGFNVAGLFLVRHCIVNENETAGIIIDDRGTVLECQVWRTTNGPGILSNSSSNNAGIRIEGNSIIENQGWGISVPNAGGVWIFRNTLLQNASGTIDAPSADAPIGATSTVSGGGPYRNVGS
jgi:hypothetical protein